MSGARPKIVDFHVHIFPDRIQTGLGNLLPPDQIERLQSLRKRGRSLMRRLPEQMHRLQPMLRNVPAPFRRALDELSSVATIPNLIVESTTQDLVDAMDASQVDLALAIAHPPYAPNELILDEAEKNPRIIPVVNVPPGTKNPAQKLRNYAKKGARVLKIHAASDGENAKSPRYLALLRAAADLGMPVILHTGCIHISLLYKDALASSAEKFEPWFRDFPSLTFVLAHMNFHEPEIAIDLMERYPNVYADTSWQPSETILLAVSRVGADRLLFGTDWPLVGNNMEIGIQRIEDAAVTGEWARPEVDKILGGNALKILGWDKALS